MSRYLFRTSMLLHLLAAVSWQVRAAVAWSCFMDANSVGFNATLIAGDWYEAVRLPAADVPACVKVIAPNATDAAATAYNLQVDYINNANRQWQPESETLAFPANVTETGTFVLTYSQGGMSVGVIYKLLETDYRTISVVCGYSTIAPSITYVKVLTRQQQLSESLQNQVHALADAYGLGAQLTFVQQTGCNAASPLMPTVLTLLLVLVSYGLRMIF